MGRVIEAVRARKERVLRAVGRYLSEPGFRAGNPLTAEQFKTGSNFAVVQAAGEIAHSRRIRTAHFTNIDGDPFKVHYDRQGTVTVSYKGDVSRRSRIREAFDRRAEQYQALLRDPADILGN